MCFKKNKIENSVCAEISDKMEQSAMRFITDYYDEYPSNHFITKDALVYKEICQKQDSDKLVKYLEAKGYIEYKASNLIDSAHIQLTPPGKTYFEDKREAQKVASIESIRFWISILADVLIFCSGMLVEHWVGIVSFFFGG